MSSSMVDSILFEMQIKSECLHVEHSKLIKYFTPVLEAFDKIASSMCNDDHDIKFLLDDTRNDLVNSIQCASMGLQRPALVMLRGVLEGFLTTLYYREQGISLSLWVNGKSYVMAHQLIDPKHEFYIYFMRLFNDDGFKKDYPQIAAKCCFEKAKELYDTLSSEVHKKRTRHSITENSFLDLYLKYLNEVFQLCLAFLERVEDLPEELKYPKPLTFPHQMLVSMDSKRKK